MPRIVAYTYDADTHCPTCAAALHGDATDFEGNPAAMPLIIAYTYDVRRRPTEPLDEHGVREDATDFEGNPVYPVFADEEWCNAEAYGCTLECSDCSYVCDSHEPSLHGYRDCRDGCYYNDCGACAEDDEPANDEDEYEPVAAGCQCDACTAPDYVPGADELCDPTTYFTDLELGAPAPASSDDDLADDDLADDDLADDEPEHCARCYTQGPVYATGLCAACASPCRGLHFADGTLGEGAWPHTCAMGAPERTHA